MTNETTGFRLYVGSANPKSYEAVHVETIETEFFNLKNKATGARRYGYRNQIMKAVNANGEVAFRFDLQTTLDGSRYQSSKQGEWFATQAEAQDALLKALAGALKRYTKLSKTPGSGVEYRDALGHATTAKIGEAADRLKK